MDSDDDWEIGEDFLDDFIPRDEKLDSTSNANENSSKNQNSENIVESSISFCPRDNENSENDEPENSCHSPSRDKSIHEIPESQNPRALNVLEVYSRQVNENLPKNPGNRVNFRDNDEIDNEDERNDEKNTENREISDSQENPKIVENRRENLIKSILNRRKTRIDVAESVTDEKSAKFLNRQNFIQSILKRGANKMGNETREKGEENAEMMICRKQRRNVSFSGETSETEKLNQKSVKKADSSRGNDSKSSTTKHVIHRKFPGPAGILPDNLDFSNFPMAYLNSFDESEKSERLNESRITNFCSQNTKNRFTSGAWQLMMDDLPADFFQGLDIATIKRQAKRGQYKLKTTSFFAALVHHIDSNSIVNPSVILKDSSDEIEASIHRKLFFQYPNTIEVGCVLLLHDVAIITSKLHHTALIHPRDLVAIYNEKERIVTTKLMENILNTQEGGNFEKSGEICNRGEDNVENHEMKVATNEDFLETGANRDSNEEQINAPEEIVNPTQILHDDDDDENDNEFLSQVNLDEISMSHNPRNIASSTLIGSQIHVENIVKSPENNRQLESSKKSSLENVQNKNQENPDIRPEINSKTTNFADLLDSDDEILDESISKKTATQSKKTSVEETRKESAPRISKLQSRLKEFRHRDELSQLSTTVDNSDKNKGEKNPKKLNFADLLNSGDEIDDEIMDINIDEEFNRANENESHEPVENTQQVGNEVRSFFNDPDDEFLSQMNIDDF